MTTIVFSRDGWMPSVLDADDGLLLEVVGGADALHGPRTFTIGIREEHLEALRSSVRRHVLLLGPLLPLCYEAGIGRDWDQDAAARLTDAVLLAAPHDVDQALREVRIDRRVLIAHHGSIPLLQKRRYYEAMSSATVASDWDRVRKHLGP